MPERKVIITVAPTGSFQGKEANPNLPIQPDEIARDVYDSYNAGAAVVHIHARDKNGVQTSDTSVFKETNSLVRAKCDIIIQNSIAPPFRQGTADVDEGLQALDAMPEMASLDMVLSGVTYGNSEIILEWTRSFLRKAAKIMLERGIKPELEIYNNANMEDVQDLIDRGLLTKPYYLSFVMGMNKITQGAVSFSPKYLMHYLDIMAPESIFSVVGVGANQLPATLLSILLGGNARVGLEDNIYYRRGELAASNAQLVDRLVKFVHELGLEVASPAEAREILGIPQLRR